MRILVLGGTHFIGPWAVRRLADRGHEVAVFHRGRTDADLPSSVRRLHGDRARLSDFAGDFRQFAPDVVLDMVPCTEQEGKTLVELFTGMARRIVAISSGDVYRAYDRFRRADPGPPDPAPLTEDSPLRDRLYPYRDKAKGPEDFAYSYEKILMERAVMGAPETLPATVLRLPMVYGPGDYQHRLFPYVRRMDDGRPAVLLSEGMASWRGLRGYVEDMGEAIALCVVSEQAAGRTYHVADRQNHTEAEWVQRLANAIGWKGKAVVLPEDRMPEHLRTDYDFSQDWSLDSSRIRAELGYAEPTLLEEALQRSVAWERAHPPASFDPALFDYAAEDAALAAVQQPIS
jgi:nucleoside-diphosphate-sugar epimerase